MDNLYNCGFCERGYLWSAYSETQCVRINTTTSTPPVTSYSLTSFPNSVYGTNGTNFYDIGFPTDGVGTVVVNINTGTIWDNPAASVDGPLNRCGIWTTAGGEPFNHWVGFSACLSVLTETKTYYIGIAADNFCRLVLDGVEIVNFLLDTTWWTPSAPQRAFKIWHVYPVVLSPGDHTIELYGLNTGSIGEFGCEIYDNTLSELTGATSLSDINIIFSSSAFTEATLVQTTGGTYTTSGYSCPSGYVYSVCDGNCVQYTFCDSPPSCSLTQYCLSNTGISGIDNIYSATSTYNGFSVFSSPSEDYYIYYSNDTSSWCLSNSLGGSCILEGKSPCISVCPDLCDTYFFSGACPTPTPTPTVNCNSFDFDSIFDCAVTPSPTVTPSITPTISITPSPSSTVFCPVGINASISAFTPTPTVTPTITPSSSSPVVRDCVVSGDVIFNTVDTVLVCQSSSRFQDCYNGFDYYTTTVSTQPNGSPITEFMIFQATVDGERRCISYVGQNNTIIGANNITLTTNVIGYVNLGQCIECIGALTQTPTPTPTITPTNTPTPSVTTTPFNTPSNTHTVTPTPSVEKMYYLYKNCRNNDYILQNQPAVVTTVGEVMLIASNNPTVTAIKKDDCWVLISVSSTPPSINPIWNVSTFTNNVFTSVNSQTYPSCDRCATAASGGSTPQVSQSPTPTRTNTPTPTLTPTKSQTPQCYPHQVYQSLNECSVCQGNVALVTTIYSSSSVLTVGSVVYNNSICTVPVPAGRFIQVILTGNYYQVSGGGTLLSNSCSNC